MAVQGGSLSILEDKKEIDFWIGETENAKVEDILEQIFRLIEVNRIKKEEIDLIAVSRGPGSFTGARIGLATALGLKTAWNCEIVGVSVFEAMMLKTKTDGRVITAIPFGRRQISWQLFDNGNPAGIVQKTMPAFDDLSVFLKSITTEKHATFIFHSGFHQKLFGENWSVDKRKVEFISHKIATLIGLKAQIIKLLGSDPKASDNIQGIYLNNK